MVNVGVYCDLRRGVAPRRGTTYGCQFALASSHRASPSGGRECPEFWRVLLGLGCTKSEPSTGSSREAVWQESTTLSQQQKSLLENLYGISGGEAFAAQEWTRGESVLDLHLRFPLDPSDLKASATEFLRTYGQIWHVSPSALNNLRVVNGVSTNQAGCKVLDFQLFRGNSPVYNATLRFSVNENSKLTRVVGLMDGRRLNVDKEGVLAMASGNEATQAVLARLDLPETSGILSASKGWLDTYFTIGESLSVGGQDAINPAWIVRPANSGPNAAFPVDGTRKIVALDGPSFDDSQVLDTPLDECNKGIDPNESGTAWLAKVVVDDATGTPASLGVEHFGGLRMTGTSPGQRALNLFSVPQIQRMYGDGSPTDHLVETRTAIQGSRAFVSFDERVAGRRVEGAYVRVELENQRVLSVFSKFAFLPVFSTVALATPARARADVIGYLRGSICTSTTICPPVDAQLPSLQLREEVVWTTNVQGQRDQAAPQRSEIAAKFVMNHVTIWYGLQSFAVLRVDSAIEGLSADLPNRIWSATGQFVDTSCPAWTGWGPLKFHPCDKSAQIDILTPPAFRLEVDVDATRFPPLDPRSIPGFEQTDKIADALLSDYGYSRIQGDGGMSAFNPSARLDVVLAGINGESDNATAPPLTDKRDLSTEDLGIFVGSALWAPDIIAHEYAHFVTNFLAFSYTGLEHGALKEAVSDLFGAVIFPADDQSWRIASASPGGAIRNMNVPRDPSTTQGPFLVDHNSLKGNCDLRNNSDGCSYSWVGIPSRALALIADGAPSADGTSTHPGFGRKMTLGLVLETLRDHDMPWHLAEADRFLNFRLKLEGACRTSVTDSGRRGRWVKGRTLSSTDCAVIGAAFDAVGVAAAVRSGFDRAGSMPAGNYSRTEYSGRRLFNGCSVSGHSLTTELRDANRVFDVRTRSSTDLPPLFIDISGGEVVARVTERCGSNSIVACPDNTNRQIAYVVDSKWLADLKVFTDESLSVPSGVPMASCFTSVPGNKVSRLQSSPIVHAVSIGPFGAKFDQALTPNTVGPSGALVAAPCSFVELGGLDGHRAATFPAPVTCPEHRSRRPSVTIPTVSP